MFFSGHRVLNFQKYMLTSHTPNAKTTLELKKKIRGNFPTNTWSLNCLPCLSPDNTRRRVNTQRHVHSSDTLHQDQTDSWEETGGIFSARKPAPCKGLSFLNF